MDNRLLPSSSDHAGDICDARYFTERFRQGTLTPGELTEQALALAESMPEVFISLMPERARREAADATLRWQRGVPLSLLDGIPIAWKDLFDLAGSLTTAGSATRLNSPLATKDAAVVARLQAAGMISLGKTNLSEFAYSGLGLNPHFGTPAIYDRSNVPHAPGGSSCGSACAVARGVVPIALGTDTAGSIRIPAAFNGLIGYRSSRQRYSRRGVFPLAANLGTLGPICRSVRDAITLDQLLAGSPTISAAAPLRGMVEILNDQSVEHSVKQNLLNLLDKLTAGGVLIDRRPVAALHHSLRWIAKEGWPGAVEALALHRPLLDGPLAAKMDARVRTRLMAAKALPADLLQRFLQQRAGWQRQIRAELNGALLVIPTVAHVAPALAPLENDAAMGGLDAALAAQGAGLARFTNVGNLNLEEIDNLTSVLSILHRQGHFAAFWASQDEAYRLIDDPRVSIQSLWSPTYFRHHYQQQGYKLATPREGYRAWYGGLSLSRCTTGRTLDAAYDYLNWWQSGWPGAMIAKQGYYISNPQRSRPYLSPAEWDYWYAGKAASENLPDAYGNLLIPQGETRDGGSYEQRMSHIAVWNSVMDEHNYLVRRWHDFLRA